MTLKISKINAFSSILFGGFRQICDQKNPRNEESKALSAITKMQISKDYSILSDMELDIGLSLLLSKIMIKESRL